MRLRGIFLACLLSLPLVADEGMWLFNQFPKGQLKQKYGQDITDGFLEHLRLSSLRVGGGSGSFVSPNGLIFTNHHVASDCIAKLGSAQHDYMKEGFSASTPDQELPCPGMDAKVLVSLENVTTRVKDAAKDEAVPAQALQKRAGTRRLLALTIADPTRHYRGSKLGNAAQVAPIDKLSVVLVAIFGVLFLGEKLAPLNWFGVALIAAGALLVAL